MPWITPKIDWEPSDIITEDALNRIEGNIDYIETSNRYPNESATPDNSGTLSQIIDFLATMIKKITGKSNWYTAPRATLENVVKRNGDTFTGPMTASSAPTSPLNYAHVRNVTIQAGDPPQDSGADGDIWLKYTP